MQTPSPGNSPETNRRAQTSNTSHEPSTTISSGTGGGIMTHTSERQPTTQNINLSDLPIELVVAFIMKPDIYHHPESVFRLSFTCSNYIAHYRREVLPFLQEEYISNWNSLMQLDISKNKSDAAKCMQKLLDLLPYFGKQIEALNKKIRSIGFPNQFDRLADIHFDWCLQLIAIQFGDHKAREFIKIRCHYYTDFDDIAHIRTGRHPSVLQYALAGFHKHKGNKRGSFYSLLNLLFKKGGDLERRNKSGETALNYLLGMIFREKDSSRKKELCKLAVELIRVGADYNAKDKKGHTFLSRILDNLFTVEFFVKHAQLKVNGGDTLGESMIWTAIEKFSPTFSIEILIEQMEINIHARDKENLSILEYAIQQHNLRFLVVLLMEKPIYANTTNAQGDSALHYAIKYHAPILNGVPLAGISLEDGILPLIQALLRNGVDVNIRNNDGLSALDVAIEHNFFSIIPVLLNAPGIKPNTCVSALKYAIKKRRSDMMETLLPNIIIGPEEKEFIQQELTLIGNEIMESENNDAEQLINIAHKLVQILKTIDSGVSHTPSPNS
jgi:ankyrin repeat protein